MYVRGTTLSLAWYRGNIGHQFFDSLLPLVPFLGKYLVTRAAESDFGVRDSELFSAASTEARAPSRWGWGDSYQGGGAMVRGVVPRFLWPIGGRTSAEKGGTVAPI